MSTILLVEDNPITRKMRRLALESEGYGVVEAGDGRGALEAATASPPELLVLDHVLPDADGLQLLEEIRRRAGAPELPALVVTGMVSRLDELSGRGGAFTHFLPKPVEPTRLLEVVRAHLAVPESEDRGLRILVLDDEPLNLKLAELRLRQAGYQVETASGGAEGLEKARRHPPDAILADVLMPSMDGFAFCAELRRDSRLAAIPIVLVSEYVEEADRELACCTGANALVIRSEDWRDVATAIEQTLRGSGAPPGPASLNRLAALHRERVHVQLERQTGCYEALQQQAAIQSTALTLTLMKGLSEALAQPQDVPKVTGEVLVQCLDAAGLSTGLLYLVDPGSRHRLQARCGIPIEARAEAEACFGHPELIRRIVESGQPTAFSSGTVGADDEAREFLARLGHASVLMVPLIVLGQDFGALVLASDIQDLSGTSWISFARNLASQFGQTVALGQSLTRLAASESRLRALMEQANDTILILDPARQILEANREAERLLGRPREQIVGRCYDEFVVHEEREGFARRREALLTQGTLRVESRRFLRADGTSVPAEVSASLVQVGDQPLILAILRDLTERQRGEGSWSDVSARKEAELRLQTSEEQYRLLFESNPQPMWVFDEESLAFLAVNDAAVRHYGWSREEFLGMTIEDVRPPGEVPGRLEFVARSRREDHALDLETLGVWKHRKKDGTLIDVEGGTSPIVFLGRRAWLTLATDVTRRKRLKAELVQSQKMNLPTGEEAAPAEPPPVEDEDPRGTETILVVEDESALGEIVRECLEAGGYTVLQALDGLAALELSKGHPGPIHLLVTDVVMPGLNGSELARRLTAQRPELKVLYMSGYTDDAVALYGVLTADMPLLEKPFTGSGLARRVREVLDRP